jgi:hypothetical protein
MSWLSKIFRRRHRDGESRLQNGDAQGSSPSDVSRKELEKLKNKVRDKCEDLKIAIEDLKHKCDEHTEEQKQAAKRMMEIAHPFGYKGFEPSDPEQLQELRELNCKLYDHDAYCYRIILGSADFVCLRCGYRWFRETFTFDD